MGSNNITDNFKFWSDQNIIYCKVYNDFTGAYHTDELENVFLNEIFKLSKDVHMPILINLEALSISSSIKVFRILSKNALIKSLVLSKTFLVNSYFLKSLLNIQSVICNPVVPDSIFKDPNSAVNYCVNDNKTYNSLN